MAYAYTAVYGYYKDPNASGHDVADLNGLNVSAITITSPTTLYTIPESLELPSPKSLTATDLVTATKRIKTVTEYQYITIIPYLPYNPNYPSLSTLYPELTSMVENLMPGAFIYSRSLFAASISCFGTTYETFAYLTDISIIITSHGAMYSVDGNGDISLIFTQGNYFITTYVASSFNPQSAYWYANGRIDVSFIYSGSWYTNHYSVGLAYQLSTQEITSKTYTIWEDTNRTSLKQNELNANLIGTADNPKYKYKTDPANPNTDPYTPPFTPLNPSGPGGGDGTHDPEHDGDAAPIPDITQFPQIADTGLISIWNPGSNEINLLADVLTNASFQTALANFANKPIDLLIGLNLVPVPVTTTNDNLYFAKIAAYPIPMARVTSQYVEVDCGGFDCDKIYGSYLDYNIRFQIFLPFIGFRPLQAEDVIGHVLTVKYHVDVLTGSCIAYVLSDYYCSYTFTGNCSYQIPLTNQSYENIVGSLIQTAGTVGAAVIAPESAAGASALSVAGSTLNTLNTKPTYQRSGGIGGNSAFLGMRTPFLVSYVPRLCSPQNQNKIMGYPSYQTKTLSSVTGYTECLKVHVNGIGATDTEKTEIENYLLSGVIL